MKIVVTGAAGLLGSNVCSVLKRFGHDVLPFYHSHQNEDYGNVEYRGDLLDKKDVTTLLAETHPDAVVNCVGWTNVDKCESNPRSAWLANAESVVELSRLTYAMGIRLVHISTDHVFDGKESFYTEVDIPNAVNVYGWSKLGGERACLMANPNALVVRTNFYGWAPDGHTPTFVDWIYTSLRDKKPIQLFTDYYFNALEVHFLAEALEKIVSAEDFTYGVLNIASSERMSKYDFGIALASVFGLSSDSVTATEKSVMRVPRPPDLSLSVDKFNHLFGYKPAGLLAGLHRLKATLGAKTNVL